MIARVSKCGIGFLLSCGLIVACSPALTVGQESKSAQRASQEQSPDQQEIQKLLDAQVACWNRRDLEGFMQTYWKSENLTFSSGGQTTRGWQATLDRYRGRYQADGAEMGQLSFGELEIQLLNADVALVLGTWHLEMSDSQPHGNFSLVLRRISENWKIIHDHSSSVENTPE